MRIRGPLFRRWSSGPPRVRSTHLRRPMFNKLPAVALLLLSAACGIGQTSGDVGASGAGLGSDPAQYAFETGTQGWVKAGSRITSVAASPTQVFLGNQSLVANV